MFLIRVDFPDEDKYAFVKNSEGELKKFYDYSMALDEARKWAGAIVIELKDDSDITRWES